MAVVNKDSNYLINCGKDRLLRRIGNMEVLMNKSLKILADVQNLHKLLEVLILGLDIKEEHYAVSVMELQKNILSSMETELEDIILHVELLEEKIDLES